jgi:hypothetical protein
MSSASDQAKLWKLKQIWFKNGDFWPYSDVFTAKIGLIRNVMLSQQELLLMASMGDGPH